jgi:histidine ammonia-lyase
MENDALAMTELGLEPYNSKPRRLALINGTQLMNSYGAFVLER